MSLLPLMLWALACGIPGATQPHLQRSHPRAIPLATGAVLFIDPSSPQQAEIYDPAGGTWLPIAGPGLSNPATITLPDGKVLFANGFHTTAAGELLPVANAVIFDPSTHNYLTVSAPNHGISRPQGALLGDGTALISGCTDGKSIAQTYDPGANTWSDIPAPPVCLNAHATLTPIAQGALLTSRYAHKPLIYTTATKTWTPTSRSPKTHHGRALALPDGRVLLTDDVYPQMRAPHGTIYDPSSDTWAPTGQLNRQLAEPEPMHGALLMHRGKALLVGGAINQVESLDLQTGIWSVLNAAQSARQHGSATVLPDGSVLLYGGADPFERYTPNHDVPTATGLPAETPPPAHWMVVTHAVSTRPAAELGKAQYKSKGLPELVAIYDSSDVHGLAKGQFLVSPAVVRDQSTAEEVAHSFHKTFPKATIMNVDGPQVSEFECSKSLPGDRPDPRCLVGHISGLKLVAIDNGPAADWEAHSQAVLQAAQSSGVAVSRTSGTEGPGYQISMDGSRALFIAHGPAKSVIGLAEEYFRMNLYESDEMDYLAPTGSP